jgi:phytoene synthase
MDVNTKPTPPLHPEQVIAVAYAPRLARESLGTLFAIDERLGEIVGRAREPMIGLMRLTWWRDALAALDRGPPPGEPLLHAAAALRPDRISGTELSLLAEGWEVVLDDPDMTPDSVSHHAAMRGASLFRLAGRVLGGGGDRLEAAGEGWALADLARRLPEPAHAAMLLEQAGERLERALVGGWPRSLRPLGMLAVLAREDSRRGHEALRPPASRGRLLRLIAHRWTGR